MAKILLVDDSETFRMKLREPLEKLGHSIVEAEDGLYGLEVLAQHPDCEMIFCDLNMPRMDGLTFCRKIHNDTRYSKISIIILSTESNEKLRQEAKSYGVKAWIIKPFDEQKLVAGVNLILTKGKN